MIFLTGALALGAGYLGYLLGLRRERGRLDRLAELEREALEERYSRRQKRGVVLNRVQLVSKRSDRRYRQSRE